MTGVCVSMKPTSIEDLTAIVALYRPGPMDSIPKFIANKQNAQRVTYKTPLAGAHSPGDLRLHCLSGAGH